MANLSQLTLPVKDTITGQVTSQTFDLAGGDSKNFVGTRSEWNALTTAEKAEYETMDIYGEFNAQPIDSVPTQGSTNAVASGGVYTAIATATSEIEDPKVYISGVEETSTASQAYTVGKYLIYNGALYKVIASIALGDSLTPGTNISATKLADEVSNHLSVNGTEFFFDTHDGQFGYNTSANRGADTFVPFKGTVPNTYRIWSAGFSYMGGNAGTDHDINTCAALILERDKIENFSSFVITASGNNVKCGYTVDNLPTNYAGSGTTWVTLGATVPIPTYTNYIAFVLFYKNTSGNYLYASFDGTVTFS